MRRSTAARAFVPSALAVSLMALTPAATAVAEGPVRNGFSLADSSVPAREILPGGPARDGIPALDHPEVVAAPEADWKQDTRVLGVRVNGQARAYPVPVLDWHELVNDSLGGRPILVSYCPLCRTGMVFDRRIDGKPRSFGVSGLLYQSDVLMYDRETESLWSQIMAQAVTGPGRGTRLELLRSRMDTWGAWRAAHPGTTVLSRSTGYRRDYDRSPYADYARSAQVLFPVRLDRRYHPKTPTLGLRWRGGRTRAYPAPEVMRAGGAVAEELGGARVRVAYDPDRDRFEVVAPEEVEVVEGYWFAWAAFHPQTSVFVSTAPATPGAAKP